jgi:hypothetical protein
MSSSRRSLGGLHKEVTFEFSLDIGITIWWAGVSEMAFQVEEQKQVCMQKGSI